MKLMKQSTGRSEGLAASVCQRRFNAFPKTGTPGSIRLLVPEPFCCTAGDQPRSLWKYSCYLQAELLIHNMHLEIWFKEYSSETDRLMASSEGPGKSRFSLRRNIGNLRCAFRVKPTDKEESPTRQWPSLMGIVWIAEQAMEDCTMKWFTVSWRKCKPLKRDLWTF